MDKKYYILFLLTAIILACTKSDHYYYHKPPEAAICLSFDDYPVDEWFKLRELFLKYDARVTFFVTRFDTLTAKQIEKLKILQNDGHEIGFHGAKHVLSEYYIKDHSLEEYIKNEIVAGVNSMNDSGFYPTSFAYPYSAKYWGTDKELLKYFYVIRSEVPYHKGDDITELDDIFYKYDGSRLLYAIAIDRKGNLDSLSLQRAIHRIMSHKEVLMLYGHEPNSTFDVSFLTTILKTAKANNLKFLRASDLVK